MDSILAVIFFILVYLGFRLWYEAMQMKDYMPYDMVRKLIIAELRKGDKHAYELQKCILATFTPDERQAIKVLPLYPVLWSMEEDGDLVTRIEESGGRVRRYYHLINKA